MRLRLLMYAFILLIASCQSDDESYSRSDVFQVAYGTPDKLHPSSISYVSDNNNYIVAATTSDESTNPGIIVYNVDNKGSVRWSNRMKTSNNSRISVSHLVKLSGENYLIVAQYESQAIFIQVDNAGNVISSKKIESNYNVEISSCHLNGSGHIVAIGNLGKQTVVFEFNPSTNLIKWSRQISHESVGAFAVASGKFSFITSVDPFGNLQLLKFDNVGNVVTSKKFYTNSSYFSAEGKSVVLGDHLYLASSFLQSNLVGLLKIDLSGNIKTAMRLRDVEFSDLKVYGKDLLFSINLQKAATLLRINTNFEVVSHKTIADAMSSEAPQRGMLGLNDNYISYTAKPNNADESINFTKLDRKTWKTSCDRPILSLGNDLISAITIYQETTEIESQEASLSVSDYEVQTEPVTLTKTIVCQQLR
jgi:hypothetical protein